MILYHGSNMAIDMPDLSRSKPYKDFGRGFYLSADRFQAQRMGEQRTLIEQEGTPTITKFLFDESLLHNGELKTKIWENYCEEWAQFIVMNRDMRVPQPCHDYGIVYGPIADDGVTYLLRRYKAGAITFKELLQELRYPHGITFQYHFGTQRALSTLKHL